MKQVTLTAAEYRETLKKRPRRASWRDFHAPVTDIPLEGASFTLSLPPSVNRSTFNLPRGGRAKTKAYKDWREASLKSLLAQRAKPVRTPAVVTISLPSFMSGDVDNRIKPSLDLLVTAGVIPDDRREFVPSINTNYTDREDMLIEVRAIVRGAT